MDRLVGMDWERDGVSTIGHLEEPGCGATESEGSRSELIHDGGRCWIGGRAIVPGRPWGRRLLKLARRGLVPQFQRAKPRGKPMPPHIARGNATRARVRVAIEHVFAAQKCRLGLVVRSVDLARATARLGLANLVTNMTRLAWFATRAAPA